MLSIRTCAPSLLCVLALGTAGLAHPASAHANRPLAVARVAPSPTADDLSNQAVEAFGEKRFEEAVDLFNEAYAIDSNPNYLFNIGRVYEEQGDLAAAVEYYQRFVSQPSVDIEAREAATARLRVLREALKQLEEEKEPEVTEPQPAPVTDTPDEEEDDPRANRIRAQRIAGYSLLGAGGVALIVGGVLGGLARGKVSDADNAEFVDDQLRLRDEARGQARGADAMYITGGVLAGVGLVLVLTTLGKGKGKADAQAATRRRTVLAPAAGKDMWGATVQGRF